MSQPCNNCHSPCCRNYNVVITLIDAYRLASTLSLPIVEIAEMRYIDEPDGEYRAKLNGKPDAEPRFHRIVLRKVVDPDPQYNGRCLFLLSIGERGRCGVYSMRPFVCATYPTSFEDGVIGLNAGGKYCPPNAWHLEQMNVPVFRARQSKRQKQRWLHEQLMTAWNARIVAEQRESSVTEFFGFVVTVCGELERFQRGTTSLDEHEAPDFHPRDALNFALDQIGWPRSLVPPPAVATPVHPVVAAPVVEHNEASSANVSSTETVQ